MADTRETWGAGTGAPTTGTIHGLSDELRGACGWCDQDGRHDTEAVSVSVLRLRKWVEMAYRLELALLPYVRGTGGGDGE